MGSALVSVVPQIFWPHARELVPAADCSRVEGELARSLETLRAVRSESERDTRFAAWDERYAGLAGACGSSPGYTDLYRARYAVEAAAHEEGRLTSLLEEVRAHALGDR